MTSLQLTRRQSVLLVAALIAACGGDGPGAPPAGELAVAKASPSGDAQTGAVAQTLGSPLRVIVTGDGQPAAGATVTWTGGNAGASMNPAQAATDAQGIASSSWTLGQAAGAQTATATVAGATGSPVAFAATATAAGAASLALAGGNAQSAVTGNALANPLQAKVTDQFGNAVSGVSVTWAVTGGGGSLAPPTSPTNALGIAASAWTLGAEGPQTAEASAAALAGSPVHFTATATAPVTATGVTVGNNTFTPAIRTVPAGTNVVWTWTNTGVVSHSVESTGSPSFPSSAILLGNGQTYSRLFTTPGTYTYQCLVHGSSMSGTIVVQ